MIDITFPAARLIPHLRKSARGYSIWLPKLRVDQVNSQTVMSSTQSTETHRIRFQLEPLIIDYRDFEEIELAHPNYHEVGHEQIDARIKSLTSALSRFLTPIGKRFSRRKAVRGRQEYCKLFHDISTNQSLLPQITQRNLDSSLFLSLSLELRQQCYKFYYASDSAKIQDLTYDGTFMLTSFEPCSPHQPPGRGHRSGLRNNLLGLPLTCRTIYPEAMAYLYEKISIRFTDPRLAIAIPQTIPMQLLHAVKSLDFSFFLQHIINTPGISPDESKLDVLMSPLPKLYTFNAWHSLWSTIASLRSLQRVSLELYNGSDNSSRPLQLPQWLSQAILDPLFLLEKDPATKVLVGLCWRPDDDFVEALETAGFEVVLNGRYNRGVHARA